MDVAERDERSERARSLLPELEEQGVIAVATDGTAVPPQIDGRALVVGRDIHRQPGARAVVDGLRAGGGTVVTVEMGWPSDDRRYADVATFGSSRAVGAALLGLLTGTGES